MNTKIELSENWRSTYPVRHVNPFEQRTTELISDPNWEPSIDVKEYLADLNAQKLDESYREWVRGILPILPALIEWNSINPYCVEWIKLEGEKSFYRWTLFQVRYNQVPECRSGNEEIYVMREYEKLLDISEIAKRLVLWLREARSSNSFKYARFFKELINSIPKEAGMRLLRAQLQRNPLYNGLVSEILLETKYANLVQNLETLPRSTPSLRIYRLSLRELSRNIKSNQSSR